MSYQSEVACWDVRRQREQLRPWTAILHCHGIFLSVTGDLQFSAPLLHMGALVPQGTSLPRAWEGGPGLAPPLLPAVTSSLHGLSKGQVQNLETLIPRFIRLR